MQLFHYHYWTPFVEETEQTYRSLGFEVKGRFTKDGAYHPPLKWDDFREEQPTFRIIEMRKGQINITFGYSKKKSFLITSAFLSQTKNMINCLHKLKN
ncbi:hypothetical protein BsIDN1_07280 [Bacillus safensis]|uniref:Uncharacterized protein n=1 Tax=Bacillus safensis TaxID=561879 RepID=A0A5S9M0G6_BACIA|nr:hypothetical protein BsIDN1_07280 [Bacillus safensis]